MKLEVDNGLGVGESGDENRVMFVQRESYTGI